MSFTNPQSQLDGQRAHVTLLFSDVCDFTRFSELSDPEEIVALRRRLEEVGERVIRRHRGVLTQCYGDGLLALFGFPEADEDAPRRAVEAALELHQVACEIAGAAAPDFQVRMHSGVHAGLIFVRSGDALHGRFEVTGDAVNTAARLAAAAARDQVLVSGTTLRGVEAFFASEPKLELQIKGKRAPLLAHHVLGRSEVRTRSEARARAGLTPFAGRKAEAQKLLRQVEGARNGQGRIVLVTGSAGIGKTRLLEEVRQQASDAGVLVLSGSCDNYGEVPPLEPFLQMLRQLLGIQPGTSTSDATAAIGTKVREWEIEEHELVFLRLLSLQPRRPTERVEVTALSALRAFAALIGALSKRFTLACILDDWQWADDISQRVLSRIGRVVRDQRACILVAMREENQTNLPFKPDLSLHLSPLSIDESRQVIAVLRSKDLDLGLSGALHERSGGNPLYLEELCHSLPNNVVGEQVLEGLIPSTLQGLIQARASRLDHSQIRTLQRASVIGLEFSITLLGPKEERADAEAALAKLVEQGLVLPTSRLETFRFKHGITREVVYGTVRIADRCQIHDEIARELDQRVKLNDLPDQSEALAFHFQGSGDYDRAAMHAELAGDKAAASSFLEAARTHYESALRSLDRMALDLEGKRRWLRVSTKWASQCAFGPNRSQLAILQRAEACALEINGDIERAHTNHMLGWFYYVFGDYASSIRHCQIAFELAQKVGDDKLMTQLWTTLGQALSMAGQYDDALTYLNRGVDLKRSRARDSIDPPAPGSKPKPRAPAVLYAHALSCRALIYADVGDFESASRDISEAVQVLTGTGHAMEPSVLSHQCIIQIRRGDWDECRVTARHTRTIAERANSIYVFGITSAFVSYSEWRLDPTRATLDAVRKAVDWLEAREFGLYLSFMFASLAEALFESGELELAARYASRAVDRAAGGDPQGEIPAYRVLARIAALKEPQSGASEHHLRLALEAASVRRSRREHALTSLCAAQIGRARKVTLQPSLSTPEEMVAAFEAMGMTWYLDQARALVTAR